MPSINICNFYTNYIIYTIFYSVFYNLCIGIFFGNIQLIEFVLVFWFLIFQSSKSYLSKILILAILSFFWFFPVSNIIKSGLTWFKTPIWTSSEYICCKAISFPIEFLRIVNSWFWESIALSLLPSADCMSSKFFL